MDSFWQIDKTITNIDISFENSTIVSLGVYPYQRSPTMYFVVNVVSSDPFPTSPTVQFLLFFTNMPNRTIRSTLTFHCAQTASSLWIISVFFHESKLHIWFVYSIVDSEYFKLLLASKVLAWNACWTAYFSLIFGQAVSKRELC